MYKDSVKKNHPCSRAPLFFKSASKFESHLFKTSSVYTGILYLLIQVRIYTYTCTCSACSHMYIHTHTHIKCSFTYNRHEFTHILSFMHTHIHTEQAQHEQSLPAPIISLAQIVRRPHPEKYCCISFKDVSRAKSCTFQLQLKCIELHSPLKND